MTDALFKHLGDEEANRELMKRGKLDLMRQCAGCGCNVSESEKRCKQCQRFVDRPREVTDADYEKAVRDGLIVPKEPTA